MQFCTKLNKKNLMLRSYDNDIIQMLKKKKDFSIFGLVCKGNIEPASG